MRRLFTSGLLALGAVGLVAWGTSSFFNDTETSVGNVFAAGDIDLQIGNTGYYNGAASPETTWSLKDLTVEKFFDFLDVKPGDYGEGTVQVRVGSNPAYVCANVQVTDNLENSLTEPELDLADASPKGELADDLNFALWRDDGDNVFEDDETVITTGPASNVLDGGTLTLADSQTNNVGGVAGEGVPADGEFFIGQAWCFGALTPQALTQDGVGNAMTPITDNDDDTEITSADGGFLCDGAGASNVSQTDSLVGNVSFYAEQSRNNSTFVCSDAVFPSPSGSPTPSSSPTNLVGAALGAYTAPTGEECDVNVPTDFSTIQAAIDDAGTVDGETVCVDSGSYNENVVVNKAITLSGDGVSTTTINGQGGGQNSAVTIASDGVIVEGFNVVGSGISAIWMNTGASGATVRYNRFTSASGMTGLTTQGQVGNTTFLHNEFVGNGASQLAYVNGEASLGAPQGSDSMDFTDNTFSGTIVPGGVVLGIESSGSHVLRNVFDDSLTSTYALVESWKSDVVINLNNFHDTVGIIVRDSDSGTTLVNAENNWWGEATPTGHTVGDVDDDPKATVAFVEN